MKPESQPVEQTVEKGINWISVKDRPPEPNERVLVYIMEFNIGVQLGRHLKTEHLDEWRFEGSNNSYEVEYWAPINTP